MTKIRAIITLLILFFIITTTSAMLREKENYMTICIAKGNIESYCNSK